MAILKFSDLIEDDGQIEVLLKKIDELEAKTKAKAKGLEGSLNVVKPEDIDEVQRLSAEVKKLNIAMKEVEKLKGKANEARKKSAELTQKERVEIQLEREATRKANLEARAIAKTKEAAAGSIEKLRAKLALVTIAWGKLSEEERLNSERGQRIINSKKEITEQLKKEELATGDARRNVGNYKESIKEAVIEMKREKDALVNLHAEMVKEQKSLKRGTSEYKLYEVEIGKTKKKIEDLNISLGEQGSRVDKLGSSFTKARNFIAGFGLALGGVAIARDAFQTVKNFEEGAADMAKTVGISTEEAKKLSMQLLEIDTKSSIEELQKIAAIGGQLGIASNDIIGFTNATDKLNVALGDEFTGGAEEITKTIGGLRNVFGDIKTSSIENDLMHIGNAMNELGASGSSTSPMMAEFAGRIGGIAIPLGLSTKQVLGLSATLEELNVSSERGGTAITKVLQKMTVDTKGFAKLAGMPLQEFTDLVNTDLYGAFQKVVEGSKKYGGSATELGQILNDLGLDGGGTSEVFLKLGSNMELLEKRTNLAGEALENTDSIINEFNTKNETLSANVEKVKNAWDEYVISADSATGASSWLSRGLGYIADNMTGLITILMRLIAGYVTYKGVLGSLKLIDRIKEQIQYNRAVKEGGKSTDDAAKSAKGFGQSLKGMGITVAIGLFIELALAIWDVASGAAQAREDLERMDKAAAQATKSVGESIQKIRQSLDLKINELNRQLKLRNISQDQYNKALEKEIGLTKKQLQDRKKLVVDRKEEYKKDLDELLRLQKIIDKNKNGWDNTAGTEALLKQNKLASELGEKYKIIGDESWVTWFTGEADALGAADAIAQLKASINATNIKIKEYNGEILAVGENLKDATTETLATGSATKKHGKAVKENTTELKANNDELQRRLQLLEDEARIRYEIAQQDNQGKQVDVQNAIDKELAKQSKSMEEFGFAETARLEELLSLQSRLKQEELKNEYEYSVKAIKRQLADEEALRMEDLARERDQLLSQKNLTKNEELKIWESYRDRVAELNQEMVDKEKIADLEIQKLKEGYVIDQEALDLERINSSTDANQQILDSQRAYFDELNKIRDSNSDEALAKLNESIKAQQKIIDEASGRRKTLELQSLNDLYEQRYQMQKQAIEDEYEYQISQVTKGSVQEQALIAEKNAKIAELQRNHADEMRDINEQIKQNAKDTWNEIFDAIKEIFTQILDRLEELAQKEVAANQKKLDDQQKAVDKQADRAAQGLENTLAFEQKEQAKKEAQLIASQKKLEKIQKTKAIWSSYTANSSNPSVKNPLAKTLKDWAILEAITASFAVGGYTGDGGKYDAAGLVHKGEFVVDKETTGALGLKNLTMNQFKEKFITGFGLFGGKTALEKNIFGDQRQDFATAVPSTGINMDQVIKELKMHREWAQAQPKQKVDINKIAEGIFEIVEEIQVKGVRQINRRRIDKNRFGA